MSGSAASAWWLPYAFGTPRASAFRRADASLLAATAMTSTNPSRRTASMWCAPTKPGPTRPMPMRFTRVPFDRRPPLASSRERRLCVGHAPFDFVDRAARAAILVFDVGTDRPLLALQQLQHLADRRVALAPRDVVALIFLAILQVQV